MTKQANLHPFSTEYYEQEVASLQLTPKTFHNVELKLEKVVGRVDGFMYKDFLTGIENVPVLFIDNELWMSLTPMEVESHFMPIQLAKGHVGVGGLGLGYYTQRILEKEEVESVTVFELDQNVIDFYRENFGEHEKLTIKKQDVRSLKDEHFDFFYNDIYPTQMDDRAIEDMARLTQNNTFGHYHFWTFEEFFLEMMHAGYAEELPQSWLRTYYPFIEALLETKGNLLRIMNMGDDYYQEFLNHDII